MPKVPELSGREASCYIKNLPKDGTKPLGKDGFDCIALKVIFHGQKGLNLALFYHFDTYAMT